MNLFDRIQDAEDAAKEKWQNKLGVTEERSLSNFSKRLVSGTMSSFAGYFYPVSSPKRAAFFVGTTLLATAALLVPAQNQYSQALEEYNHNPSQYERAPVLEDFGAFPYIDSGVKKIDQFEEKYLPEWLQ